MLDSEGNPITDEDVNNKMFVVVRNTKSAQNNLDYKMNRGDIIKLGRIKFHVKDFKSKFHTGCTSEKKEEDLLLLNQLDCRLPSQKLLEHNSSYDSLANEFEEEIIEIDCGVIDNSKNDIQCKVCWDTHSTSDNPLLNSC